MEADTEHTVTYKPRFAGVKVYRKPKTRNSEVIERLTPRQHVRGEWEEGVTLEHGDTLSNRWLRIELQDGRIGFVWSGWLEEVRPRRRTSKRGVGDLVAEGDEQAELTRSIDELMAAIGTWSAAVIGGSASQAASVFVRLHERVMALEARVAALEQRSELHERETGV